jgi:WD40 repeat protein
MRGQETKGLTNDFWLLNLATGEKKKWRSFDASTGRPTHVKVIGNDITYIDQPKLVVASAESGLTQREFVVPGPFASYSFSQNENWLVVLDGAQTLHLFDARTTQLLKSQKLQFDEPSSPLEVTSDGRYVYVVASDCVLRRWDTKTNQLTETVLKSLRDSHDHSDYITLSVNEEFLIVCGSHGDFGIYDTANLDEVWYGRSGGTQYYVEAVWLGGRRIVFTTDLGVMYAGTLSP